MQRITVPLLLALALPASALASDVQPTVQHVYTFAVDLGADGRVEALAPHGPAQGAVAAALARESREWVFSPGAGAQDAADTRTYLRVVVDEAADGYEVVSATTGPALAAITPPRYPLQDQLAGHEGTVVLRLDVDADGVVRAADLHKATGSVSRAMVSGALEASRHWRFSPEQVGGQAVASTLLWPVCYLGAHSSTAACAWTGPDAQRFSSKAVLPLDPAVTVSWTAAR